MLDSHLALVAMPQRLLYAFLAIVLLSACVTPASSTRYRHHTRYSTASLKYRARGLASWYGTRFHKQRTSSGEKYNMYAMTAAHRTLPIPSYVKVKNLNNGRTAIVRINDRGPFHSRRLIDLSYAAARYLGILPKGTAMVEIQAIPSKFRG